MLSILIPTYNYDCSRLVRGLAAQGTGLKRRGIPGFDYEIVVGDDASTDAGTERANREAVAEAGGRYLRMPRNLGRALILNTLAEQALGQWLLIIDCDASLCSDDFLLNYWKERDRADVVCGALKNPEGPPPSGHELRYRYEQAALHRRTVAYRSAHPYTGFTTFNVMFRQSVFRQLRFDTRCREYGYEDALFGLMLKQHGFSVRHTDNALVHEGIDDNLSFLAKTEAALRTLRRLEGPMQEAAGPSRTVRRLQRLHLCRPFAALFRWQQARWRKQLLGRNPSLFLFNLYKAGYYATLQEQAE